MPPQPREKKAGFLTWGKALRVFAGGSLASYVREKKKEGKS